MHKQINRINPENADNESDIISKLEKLIEKISRESNGACIKSQTSANRKSQRTADQCREMPAAASEPFTSQTSEQRVESVDEPLSVSGMNFEISEESDIIRGTNRNKISKIKRTYHIYGFKCIADAYRMNFIIYTLINLVMAVSIGNCMAGIFGDPGILWILVITTIKLSTDALIVFNYLGKHQKKLITPASISTGIFSFLSILIFNHSNRPVFLILEIYHHVLVNPFNRTGLHRSVFPDAQAA